MSFLGFGRRQRPAPPRFDPFQQAVEAEQQQQQDWQRAEQEARAADGQLVVPTDLEGFLRAAQETRQARIIATEKRRTAEYETRAWEAKQIAERNRAAAEAGQRQAEERVSQVRTSSQIDHSRRGSRILREIVERLTEGELRALLTQSQREELTQALSYQDPQIIKASLQQLKRSPRLSEILGDEDRQYLEQVFTSPPTFWNF